MSKTLLRSKSFKAIGFLLYNGSQNILAFLFIISCSLLF